MIAVPSGARVKLRLLHCWRGEQARFKAAPSTGTARAL
jgi:hypothetical protein